MKVHISLYIFIWKMIRESFTMMSYRKSLTSNTIFNFREILGISKILWKPWFSLGIRIEIHYFTAHQRIRNRILTSGAKHSPPSLLLGGPYGQFRSIWHITRLPLSFSIFQWILVRISMDFWFCHSSTHLNASIYLGNLSGMLETRQKLKIFDSPQIFNFSENLRFPGNSEISWKPWFS